MAILSTLQTLVPYHLLLYSLLFGSTTYQSFFNGIVSSKALPLKEFAQLQSRIFPSYFAFQAIASAVLLVTPPFALTTAGYAMLGTSLACGALNVGYCVPKSNVFKVKRNKQMEIEGLSSYRDPKGSDEMKKLNSEFRKLHGLSVLLNMSAWFAMTAYGIYLSDKLVAKMVLRR